MEKYYETEFGFGNDFFCVLWRRFIGGHWTGWKEMGPWVIEYMKSSHLCFWLWLWLGATNSFYIDYPTPLMDYNLELWWAK